MHYALSLKKLCMCAGEMNFGIVEIHVKAHDTVTFLPVTSAVRFTLDREGRDLACVKLGRTTGCRGFAVSFAACWAKEQSGLFAGYRGTDQP